MTQGGGRRTDAKRRAGKAERRKTEMLETEMRVALSSKVLDRLISVFPISVFRAKLVY
jgi:hypothetical protein